MRAEAKAVAGLLLIPVFLMSSLPMQSPVHVADGTYSLGTAYNSERKIGTDSNGNVYLAYSALGSNGSYYVRVATSRDGGDAWSDLPGIPAAANSSRSALAVSPSGAVDVVWTQGAPATSQIYYSSYTNGGWSTKALLSNSKYYSGYPSIAIDPKGVPHVVWYGYDGTYYQIYYTSLNGTNWTAPYDLSTLKEDSLNPSIAADAQGHLYVTWYSIVSRYFQIYYSEFTGTWSQAVAITSTQADSVSPSIAIQPDGAVNVVWTTSVNNVDQVFMSTRQNGEWGQKIQLTNSTYYASDPTQTFAPNGTAIVFWAAGGSIYGCPAVRACSPFLVFSGGSNLFVSVEWPRGGSSGILLMWTEFTTTSSGQRESVLFTTLATEGATPSSSPISFYGILAAVIGIAIIFMIVRYFPRKQLFR